MSLLIGLPPATGDTPATPAPKTLPKTLLLILILPLEVPLFYPLFCPLVFQMLVFADNPTKFMDEYSETFEKDFLEMMKHRYNEKRVKANDAYKEFIADRHHQHMNSTTWQTLTDFVIYLGRTGKCKVDQTPKGWFMSYINRDPAVIARREAIEKKEKMERADEDLAEKAIAKQIRQAKEAEAESGATVRSEATDMLRNPDDESKVVMTALATKKTSDLKPKPKVGSVGVMGFGSSAGSEPTKKQGEKRKMSAMEEMMLKNEQSKEKKARKDYWLVEGIIVKVMNKDIMDGIYYKRKGVVRKVVDTYTGVVKMLDDGVKIKIDQDQLETVIPNAGGPVLIVNGAYRDAEATVRSIDVDNFCVKVDITNGNYRGQTVKVDYEDVCKRDL